MSSDYLTSQSGANYDLYARNIFAKKINGDIQGGDIFYDTLTQNNGFSGIDINGNFHSKDVRYDTSTQSNGFSGIDIAGNIHSNNIQANDIGAQGDISAANDVIVGNDLQVDNVINRISDTLTITAGIPSTVQPGILNLNATSGAVATLGSQVNITSDGGNLIPGEITISALPSVTTPGTDGSIFIRSNGLSLINQTGTATPYLGFGFNATSAGISTGIPGATLFFGQNKPVNIDGNVFFSTRTLSQDAPSAVNTFSTTTGTPITTIGLNATQTFSTPIKCINVDSPVARTLNLVLPTAAQIEAHFALVSPNITLNVGSNFNQILFAGASFATGAVTNDLTVTVSNSPDGTVYADTISTTKLAFTIRITKVQAVAAGVVSYFCTLVG